VLDDQILIVQARVDDDHGYALRHGPFHGGDHGLAVLRRQYDAIDAGADAPIHNPNLRQGIALAQGAVPDDFNADPVLLQVGGSAQSTTVNRLPEFVRQAFGDNRDAILDVPPPLGVAAAQRQQARQ